MKVISRFVVLILLCLMTDFASAQNDFDLVKGRVVAEILTGHVEDSLVSGLMLTLRQDGSWPGIDYQDLTNTGFQHIRHLRNMIWMSLAYNDTSSSYYHSRGIDSMLNRSLQFWVEHDFICENWWYNQIGTPQSLVTLLLAMDGHLDPGLKEQTLRIINRANLNAPGARPGGDRIKIGGIEAKSKLATGDAAQFALIMQAINEEIRFNTGDRGMQNDYSFHHRVDRVNNTVSYGLGYAEAFVEWAAYVNGTTYSFSEEKIRHLVDYYLDGICKQYVYGIYTDPGVRNRDISRGDRFMPHSTEIPEKLLQVTRYRENELEAVISMRKGGTEPPGSFCKFFWQTEHLVFQRPGFYTSVRMYSVRNRNMEEPYNSEGLKNHHKADGASFLSVRGNEYLNIWPVYDWQKIPGTTVLQKPQLPPGKEIQKEGLTSFVGAVTDGGYGAACFDFTSPHDLIRARKSWFFFDREYVCLGAGIESSSGLPVATTLNQCLLEGEVKVRDVQGERSLERGIHTLNEVSWIYHDGVGYLFPIPATVQLSNREETGSWRTISRQWDTTGEPVKKNVFKVWIDHGARPQGRRGGLVNEPMTARDVTYQYVVIPSVEAEEPTTDRGIEILANNRWIQGVRQRDPGLIQVIFYRAGMLEISENMSLALDSPGALLIHMEGERISEITAADPSRTLDRIHLRVTGKLDGTNPGLCDIRFNRKTAMTELAIKLPGGVESGKSVTVKFQE